MLTFLVENKYKQIHMQTNENNYRINVSTHTHVRFGKTYDDEMNISALETFYFDTSATENFLQMTTFIKSC